MDIPEYIDVDNIDTFINQYFSFFNKEKKNNLKKKPNKF